MWNEVDFGDDLALQADAPKGSDGIGELFEHDWLGRCCRSKPSLDYYCKGSGELSSEGMARFDRVSGQVRSGSPGLGPVLIRRSQRFGSKKKLPEVKAVVNGVEVFCR